MKIGIYNRYWNTMGGGEKYIGTIAEILSENNQVHLIAVEPVDVEALSNRLNLNFSNVHWEYWEPLSCAELSPLTKKYDLFINSTYCSSMVSQAQRSAYIIFFPQKLKVAPFGALGQVLSGFLRRLNSRKSIFRTEAGFYNIEPDGKCWTGSEATFRLSKDAFIDGVAKVPLAIKPVFMESITIKSLGVPILSAVENDYINIKISEPADVSISLKCKTFNSFELGASTDTRELGICFALGSKNAVLKILNKSFRRFISLLDRYEIKFIDSYDTKIVISDFSNEWMQKRWCESGEILYPPIDVLKFLPPKKNKKEKIILSVGRFFTGGHNKKHIEMLQTFRGMCDRGEIPDGWEYHLAGNIHSESIEHREYLDKVKRLAFNYPIHVLENISNEGLLSEYYKSSIFWHASGWGENENLHPERFEHFGMTTCEAMAAGCVPVVIAKAGQIEIVQNGINGFTFNSENELVEKTLYLIDEWGSNVFTELSKNAKVSLRKYNLEAFNNRLWEILDLENITKI